MALNFNLSKIADYEKVCLNEEGNMHPVTWALVFLTMTVGMPRITKENWDEFYSRVHMYELAFGTRTFLGRVDTKSGVKKIQDRFITPEEVRRHIGLSTNATLLTRLQFIKVLAGGLERLAQANLKKCKGG